jgi:structural maintenance of chromosome 4
MELQQQLEKTRRTLKENSDQLAHWQGKLETLKLNDIDDDDDSDNEAEKPEGEEKASEADGENAPAAERRRGPAELKAFTDEELDDYSADELKGDIAALEGPSADSINRLPISSHVFGRANR